MNDSTFSTNSFIKCTANKVHHLLTFLLLIGLGTRIESVDV